MLFQLAEFEYKAKRISDWRVDGRASCALRLCRDSQPSISGLHPQRMRGMAANRGPHVSLN